MSKNDRIEIKVSSDVRAEFELMIADIMPLLRKKLGRRVCGEDAVKFIVDTYKKYATVFREEAMAKAQFR